MIPDVSSGVVLLGVPGSGPFSPAARWPDERRDVQHLAEVAERAMVERHGLLLKQETDRSSGSASIERYHVAYPIRIGDRVHGVVALDIAPRPEVDLQAVMRQLQWGSAWLEVLFRRDEGAKDAATRERLKTVLDLLATAAGHERFYAAAMDFTTALATRLACDRVSVGFVRGGRVHVRAISHSAHFRKQTNLVRAIGSAMDEARDQQAVIVYPPPPDSPSRVVRAHAELAQQQSAGAICSIPLSGGDRVFGVLTLERPEGRPFDPATVELCEVLAGVAGPVLETQRREDRWLVTKAAEAGRRLLGQLIGPRQLALKLAAAGLVGAIAFFAMAKGDYRVSATTVIEPAIRRAAVAPFGGYIVEARVRAGDLVKRGQVLCVLDDREMRLERLKWLSQHEQLLKQHQQALAARKAAEVRILSAQIDQARAQLALLDDQLSRTQVLAPFDGVVVSGDLSQTLGAPVEQGQVLFEVAPLDAYRVILQVDEGDIADVAVGQRGHLLLSGFPTERLPLTVEKLTPVSTAREGRNFFRVEAQLETTPVQLRPGMEGVGKIAIDRRLLIWIWTHQLTDWLRLFLWSWLP